MSRFVEATSNRWNRGTLNPFASSLLWRKIVHWRRAACWRSEFSFPCHSKWLTLQVLSLHETCQTCPCNKFLAYSTTDVEILNLISLCQTKSSLWFHCAWRFSESLAGSNPHLVCFQSHLREICAKSARKEFPVHCIISKALSMRQQKSRRCGRSHVLRAFEQWIVSWRWSYKLHLEAGSVQACEHSFAGLQEETERTELNSVHFSARVCWNCFSHQVQLEIYSESFAYPL